MYFALIRLDTSRQLTVLFAKLRSLKKPSLYYIDRRRTGAFALVLPPPPVNDMTLNENDIGDMQVRFWGGHSSRLCDSRNWNVRETSLRRMILSIDCRDVAIFRRSWVESQIEHYFHEQTVPWHRTGSGSRKNLCETSPSSCLDEKTHSR